MNTFFVRLAYKFMALVLALTVSNGLAVTPSTDEPVVVDDNALLSFVVWGDPQLSTVSGKRQVNFRSACQDLANTEGKLDAFVIVGDIAENGLVSEYRTAADMLNTASDKWCHSMFVPGNHDIRLKVYSEQLRRFADFTDSVNNSVPVNGSHYSYSYEINGYKFIMLGADKTVFEETYFSPEQLQWLESEIASTKDSGKPVFVFNHQPLKDTHGLPQTWNAPEILNLGSMGKQSDRVRKIFEAYGNVIFITGHLHTGTGIFSYEDCGNFKSFNVPTICCNNDHGDESAGQGYIFTVYENKLVARARVFSEGRFVDERCENAVVEIPFN